LGEFRLYTEVNWRGAAEHWARIDIYGGPLLVIYKDVFPLFRRPRRKTAAGGVEKYGVAMAVVYAELQRRFCRGVETPRAPC